MRIQCIFVSYFKNITADVMSTISGSLEILHTCDDGYDSLGALQMQAVFNSSRAQYQSVLLISNMSGSGGSLGSLDWKNIDFFSVNNSFVLNTTPVGCIRWVLKGGISFNGKPIVIAGTNNGYNFVGDIPSSGTVMSCLYAASRGYTALSVGTKSSNNSLIFLSAALVTLRVLNEFLPNKEGLWSLNVPQFNDAQSWCLAY